MKTAGIAFLLLLGAHLAAQPNPKEVRLLVIVDGFRADELAYYRDTVVPYLTQQAFDLVEGTSAATLIVEPRFLPTTTTIGVSRLGLGYNGLREKCYFDYDKAVLKAIHDRAGNFVPDRYLVILAGKGAGGCADGTTMFVRENAFREIVAHEMGHSFAGLFDEYGADPGQPAACVRWRNCASNAANPPWTLSTILGAHPGCDGYSTFMFHPANTCLMITTAFQDFCPVCETHLDAALTKGISPIGLDLSSNCAEREETQLWTPPPLSITGDLDVTAIVTRTKLHVLSTRELTAAERDPEVITGNVLAVATLNGNIVAIKSLAIDGEGPELTARSGTGTFERRVPREARLIRFTMFGVNRQKVLTGGVFALTLHWSERARSSFYVDQRALQLLPGTAFATYDLGKALRDSF